MSDVAFRTAPPIGGLSCSASRHDRKKIPAAKPPYFRGQLTDADIPILNETWNRKLQDGGSQTGSNLHTLWKQTSKCNPTISRIQYLIHQQYSQRRHLRSQTGSCQAGNNNVLAWKHTWHTSSTAVPSFYNVGLCNEENADWYITPKLIGLLHPVGRRHIEFPASGFIGPNLH